jgi:hypothetical protein
MKLEISLQIFEKRPNVKFNENPSSGRQLFHADRRTELTKLIVTFHNLVNAPNKKIYKLKKVSDSNTLFIVL